MKAFTLIEVMISMLIGLMTLMGLAGYAMVANEAFQQDRDRLGVADNLRMAHKELQDLLAGVDQDFFEAFPIITDNLTHAMSETIGGIQVGRSCPEDEDSMCMMVWDIKPGPERPLIYTMDSYDWPHKVTITPTDPSNPPGPGEEIAAMSVLLFVSEDQEFIALVERADAWNVFLAPEKDQPWLLPEEPSGNFEVIHLGPLSLTHVGLQPEAGYGKKLVYKPVLLDDAGWRVGRSYSSYGHLWELRWVPPSDGHPHRMLVVGRSQKPKRLEQRLEIEGKTYHWEVRHVSIEF